VQGFVVNPTFIHQFEDSGHQNFFGLIDIFLIEVIDDFLVILHCWRLVFPFDKFFDLIFVNFVQQHNHHTFTLVFCFDIFQHILNQSCKNLFGDFNFRFIL
jgi:hypothetical protein